VSSYPVAYKRGAHATPNVPGRGFPPPKPANLPGAPARRKVIPFPEQPQRPPPKPAPKKLPRLPRRLPLKIPGLYGLGFAAAYGIIYYGSGEEGEFPSTHLEARPGAIALNGWTVDLTCHNGPPTGMQPTGNMTTSCPTPSIVIPPVPGSYYNTFVTPSDVQDQAILWELNTHDKYPQYHQTEVSVWLSRPGGVTTEPEHDPDYTPPASVQPAPIYQPAYPPALDPMLNPIGRIVPRVELRRGFQPFREAIGHSRPYGYRFGSPPAFRRVPQVLGRIVTSAPGRTTSRSITAPSLSARGAGARRPPPRGTKEKKTAAQRAIARAAVIAFAATEWDDLIEAIHDALPKRYQSASNKPQDKALALWENLEHLDVPQAVVNVIYNQIEDAIVGRVSRAGNSALKDLSLSDGFSPIPGAAF